MPDQQWNPETYEKNARFVSDLGLGLLELLAPAAGERILDLGCGDGVLTEKIVSSGARVTAVDSSANIVEAARKRGLDAHIANAEALTFNQEFDAVFSNAVLHWIPNADAVLSSVYRALKPGGRFVAEMGGANNIDAIRTPLHQALRRRGIDPDTVDPWFFPTAAEYQTLLERHDFHVASITLFERPTPLPGHMSDWLRTFAQPFLRAVPQDQTAFIEEVCAEVQPRLYDPAHGWRADYTRLRFLALRLDRPFKSWRQALEENRLSREQLATLKEMVDDGQAANIGAAAAMLDWQDTVITPDEHMYGF